MEKSVKVSSFPRNAREALTILYLQNQEDLSKLSPTELATKYQEVYEEISQTLPLPFDVSL